MDWTGQRRGLLLRLAAVFGLPVLATVPGARTVSARTGVYSPKEAMDAAARMRALAIRTGDQEYGAVVVKDGRIVGQAPSRVVVNGDPTAHAEMEAIRDAARRLGTRDLQDCVLYSTSRACPMCEAAAYWGSIEGMRYGSAVSDAGAPQLHRC